MRASLEVLVFLIFYEVTCIIIKNMIRQLWDKGRTAELGIRKLDWMLFCPHVNYVIFGQLFHLSLRLLICKVGIITHTSLDSSEGCIIIIHGHSSILLRGDGKRGGG